MSTGSSVLNESPLMLRDSLQEIIFISDNDFAEEASYKRANQVLYARIKRLEKNWDLKRPRCVSDVIPESKLAKYGEYEYDAARERMYSADVGDVQCPYTFTADEAKEPWMHPEVERIFMHTAYSSFNFIWYDREEAVGVDLERAPGKMIRDDLDLPYYFNCNECEAVELRNKITSDIVRDIWRRPEPDNRDKNFKISKTSLAHMFVEDGDFKYVNMRDVDTEKNLQSLVDSIMLLNERVPKKEEEPPPADKLSEAKQPARRLYSDVVQGNKSLAKPEQTTPTKTISEDTSQETSIILSPSESAETKSEMIISSPESVVELPAESPKYSYSDAVNNGSNVNLYENETDVRSSSSNLNQNFYNPVQYAQNAYYNCRYPQPYAAAFSSNQQAQAAAAAAAAVNRPQTIPMQQQWYFNAYRQQPNLYGNFLGQLLVPQMPTKHRWSNYVRPVTPQNVYQPQNWQVYRSNSTQQMPTYQNKPKKCKYSGAPPDLFKSKPKKNAKPSKTDFKIMNRNDSLARMPVACSSSDELEKIALREYQSSNDLFFSEIERQAKEQYDGNPENLCCPPNKCVGGRAALTVYTCIVDVFLNIHHIYHFY